MSKGKEDPLDELIVDKNKEVDKILLAQILKNKVELTSTGKVNFIEKFHKYPEWKKIMIYMLARKAIFIKNLDKEMKEAAMPTEIGNAILVSGDNVGRRFARELKGIVEKNRDGYFIPNYRLVKCKSLLDSSEKVSD